MDRMYPNLNDDRPIEPLWIRNTLTKDECDEIIRFHKSHPHKLSVGDIVSYHAMRMTQIANLRIRDLLWKPIYDAIGTIRKGSDELVFPEMTSINEWHVGSYQEPHTDVTSTQELRLEAEGYLPWVRSRQWTCIFYLNDDFRGGESFIEYPGPDGSEETVYQPETGSGVIFQGMYHQHGVKKIRRKARYTISYWFTTELNRSSPQLIDLDPNVDEDILRLKLEGKPYPTYAPISPDAMAKDEDKQVFNKRPTYEKKFISS